MAITKKMFELEVEMHKKLANAEKRKLAIQEKKKAREQAKINVEK